MSDAAPAAEQGPGLRGAAFGPAAALSLLTMPLTAIWFLVAGWALLVVTAVVAATRRQPARRDHALSVGGSVALGVLVGPAVYLVLAVVS